MTNLAQEEKAELKGSDVPKKETEEVSLRSLSDMTGFPEDFIKKELLLDDASPLSMDELRESVLKYLENTAMELKV